MKQATAALEACSDKADGSGLSELQDGVHLTKASKANAAEDQGTRQILGERAEKAPSETVRRVRRCHSEEAEMDIAPPARAIKVPARASVRAPAKAEPCSSRPKRTVKSEMVGKTTSASAVQAAHKRKTAPQADAKEGETADRLI